MVLWSEKGSWTVWRPGFFSEAELMTAATIIWPDATHAGGA